MTVAEALDAERDRQGLTANALATKAGMPASQATRILSGETPNPGIVTVTRLLDALGKDLKWLHRQTTG